MFKRIGLSLLAPMLAFFFVMICYPVAIMVISVVLWTFGFVENPHQVVEFFNDINRTAIEFNNNLGRKPTAAIALVISAYTFSILGKDQEHE